MKTLDLDPHVDAQLGVEVRKRFVEKEHAWLPNEGATHRHALALSSGELARPTIKKVFDLERLRNAGDGSVALRLRHAAHFHAERHVLRHRHVRIEGVGLKHHRDVALGGVKIVDLLTFNAESRRS